MLALNAQRSLEPGSKPAFHTTERPAFMPEAHVAVNSGSIISRSISNQLTNQLRRKGLPEEAEQSAHFLFRSGKRW